MVRYLEKSVTRALVKSKLGTNILAINPYIGCEHACVYCYSPYTLHKSHEDFHSNIVIKRNLPLVLSREIINVRDKQSIFLGTVTDAYQPCEIKFRVTRKILEVLLRRGIKNVKLLTKSSLVERDLDIIERLGIEVGVTIITMDENIRKELEPGASSIFERVNTLKKLSEITETYVFIGPMIPSVTDPLYIIEELKDWARYFLVDRLRLRDNMLDRLSCVINISLDNIEKFNKKIKQELKTTSFRNVKVLF